MTRVPVWILVCLLGIAVYHADAALYKCVDPSTKWIVYSDQPCEGDGGKLSFTENAIMDGTAAQDESSRRRVAAAQEQRERALSLQVGGGDVVQTGSDAFAQYQAQASRVRAANMADRFKAEQLVGLALRSQNAEVVSAVAREVSQMNMADSYRVSFTNTLGTCTSILASGQPCTGIRAPSAHDPQDDGPAGLTLTEGGALNMRGEFCVAQDDGYLCPSGFVPK